MEERSEAARLQSFSTRMAARILAVSPQRIRYWVRRRLVQPAFVKGRSYQFSFKELLVLRLTKELLPESRRLLNLRRCFERLGERLEPGRPLTAVKLYDQEGRIVVQDGPIKFDADSGQMLLDFGALGPAGEVRSASIEGSKRLLEAAAQLEDSHPARAIKLYRGYLERSPNDGGVHRRLSALLERSGDLEGAIRHLVAVVALEPSAAAHHFDLAVLYRSQSDFANALRSFEAALERDPDLLEAHLHLAEIYERQGAKREALRHLSAAARLLD